MNHQRLVWLQAELSRIFSQLLGEEVNLSPVEALQIASTIGQSTSKTGAEFISQVN